MPYMILLLHMLQLPKLLPCNTSFDNSGQLTLFIEYFKWHEDTPKLWFHYFYFCTHKYIFCSTYLLKLSWLWGCRLTCHRIINIFSLISAYWLLLPFVIMVNGFKDYSRGVISTIHLLPSLSINYIHYVYSSLYLLSLSHFTGYIDNIILFTKNFVYLQYQNLGHIIDIGYESHSLYPLHMFSSVIDSSSLNHA